MRAALTAAFVLGAITLGATPIDKALAGGNAAPYGPPQPALGYYGYGGYTYGWGAQYGYNFIPACPTNYYYSCWPDPYGYRHCGCLLNARWW